MYKLDKLIEEIKINNLDSDLRYFIREFNDDNVRSLDKNNIILKILRHMQNYDGYQLFCDFLEHNKLDYFYTDKVINETVELISEAKILDINIVKNEYIRDLGLDKAINLIIFHDSLKSLLKYKNK